jgi:hypothetical protein
MKPEDDQQCVVTCKNKKCGGTFYISYAEAVRQYAASESISCRYCGKRSYFDLLHDAQIIEKQ